MVFCLDSHPEYQDLFARSRAAGRHNVAVMVTTSFGRTHQSPPTRSNQSRSVLATEAINHEVSSQPQGHPRSEAGEWTDPPPRRSPRLRGRRMEDATPLPGFLVASAMAPTFSGTIPEGDGPPSSDDESDMPSTSTADTMSWSRSGGSRDGSFRKFDDEKASRAHKIRSDCLSSHLVTPHIQSRSLEPSFKMPQAPPGAPSTISIMPRAIDHVLDMAKIDMHEAGESSPFRARGDSSQRKGRLNKLSSLAQQK